MNNRELLKSLINKYINNNCTSDEWNLLFQLIKEYQEEELLKEIIDQEYYKTTDKQIDKELSESMFDNIHNQIDIGSVKLNSFYKYAASLLILIMSGVFIWIFLANTNMIEVSTAYGEIKNVALADGSKITLNSNSSIRYSRNFIENRNIALSGEAYFNISKFNGKTFTVESNNISITVLGTQFNVNSRNGNTEVVLSEGKISVQLPKDEKEVELIPGELISYSNANQNIQKKKVNTDTYLAWKDSKLIFQRKTLRRIAKTLENNFGLHVVFEDEAMKELVFSGSTPIDNLDVLYQSIERLFDLKITRKDNNILLERSPNTKK